MTQQPVDKVIHNKIHINLSLVKLGSCLALSESHSCTYATSNFFFHLGQVKHLASLDKKNADG
jgi:hypothetical protein